ncbi:MAG: dimethylsulfoniopropionate demethylase [Pseudomonadota bacterium]
MSAPGITFSRRIRNTPFTSRVLAGGVQSFTAYNHMLLPSWFRGVEADYWHLCEHVQVWDVSAERQVEIAGPDATKLIQWMTPRDLSLAKDDQCFYVPLCDEQGRMVNDPIAIKHSDDRWWLSIADSDVLLWARGLAQGAGLNVTVDEPDICPVAVQGPKAEELMARVFGDAVRDIRFFRYKHLDWQGHRFLVARSGWSHQGGFEIYVNHPARGQALWDTLFEHGQDLDVGHGCPNQIERMEAGLLSFGSDMDLTTTPLQCGLDKYCHLDRDIESMSLPALRLQREFGVPSRLVGVIAEGVPSAPKAIAPPLLLHGEPVGDVTSQCLSARWDAWLGFAMLDAEHIEATLGSGAALELDTGDGRAPARVVELPFKLGDEGLTPRPR